MHLVNKRLDPYFWLLSFAFMSGYIVYEHATQCVAVDLNTTVVRHENLVAGRSEFYNPWQYRILSTMVVEATRKIYENVIPKHPPIAPFLLVKFLQTILLFYLALLYCRALGILNPVILMTGMMLICYMISNSTFQSDLSFNTYFDVIFYLLAAWVILKGYDWWILPITLLAALNRETSGFIPLMLITACFVSNGHIPKKIWILSSLALIVFAGVFLLIRFWYGFREAEGIHGMKQPMDYLVFNLTFFRMYPQLFGTLGIMPLIFLLGFKKIAQPLKVWFWLIVPFWIIIHLVKSTAVETRLFLVPQILIFVPGVLYLIQVFSMEARVNPEKKNVSGN